MTFAFRRFRAFAALLSITLLGAPPLGAQGALDDLRYGDERREQRSQRRALRYEPTTWIDPDGCEHWVMDDGAEGFMTPKVNRDGIPVCRRSQACAVMSSDALFAPGSTLLSAAGRINLDRFFRGARSAGFIIAAHTDAGASDQHSMQLSTARAEAVAAIGRAAGARITSARGYGARRPVAANTTYEGMARNRRMEIFCIG